MTTFKCHETGKTVAIVHEASGKVLDVGDVIECMFIAPRGGIEVGELYTFSDVDVSDSDFGGDTYITVKEHPHDWYFAWRFGCVVVEVPDA